MTTCLLRLLGAVLFMGTASLVHAQPGPDIRNFPATVTFTLSEVDFDLDSGTAVVTLPAAVPMEIRSNRAFQLRAQALSASFTHVPVTGDPLHVKSSTDLELAVGSNWVAMTTSPQVLLSSGSTTGYDDFVVNARINSSLLDRPGSYSITVEFSIIQP